MGWGRAYGQAGPWAYCSRRALVISGTTPVADVAPMPFQMDRGDLLEHCSIWWQAAVLFGLAPSK